MAKAEGVKVRTPVAVRRLTTARAIALARKYAKERRLIRVELIAAARHKHPPSKVGRMPDDETVYERTIRKLYAFPADLSDERLLELIDREPL